MKRILTGITTTGTPHLGNYIGAILPAIKSAKHYDKDESYFFLADWHGLIKCHEPDLIAKSTKAIAATWLACGLDIEHSVFYRQSDISQIAELNWLLACACSKGLLNRAHAYKAATDANVLNGHDADDDISMGLFGYPVLMAADILLFNATHIPVGRDQIQHIEMARDIASAFNWRYAKDVPIFELPTALIDDTTPLLIGLDGRKMSKSYGNIIPLFGEARDERESANLLKKAIMRITTNSQAPHEPKDPNGNTIFQIYQAFASEHQTKDFATAYADGIAWGDAKMALFELLDGHLAPFRARYFELINAPKQLEEILQYGASKAVGVAKKRLDKIRKAAGIRPLAKLK